MATPRPRRTTRWIAVVLALGALELTAVACGSLVATGIVSGDGDGGHLSTDGSTHVDHDASGEAAVVPRDAPAAGKDAGKDGGKDAKTVELDGSSIHKDAGPSADAHDAAPVCTSDCPAGATCASNAVCASGVCNLGECAASVTLFAGDTADGGVLRYTVFQDGGPSLSLDFPSPSANGVVVGPTGELFVGDYADGNLQRFLTPYGTPVSNGVIPQLAGPEALVFVDDQLWVAVSGSGAEVAQLAFSDAGTANVASKITAAITKNIRGIAWSPTVRAAYVTLCCGTNHILEYTVAADDSVTSLGTIMGNGLDNPNGIAISPWNELFVANAGANNILRFTLDAAGNATANGNITGNSLSTPVSLAFTPWGEMYVTDQGSNLLSRFTFDAARAAVPNGTFSPAPHVIGGWLWMAP
jgi:sugar lactone lactonase YvrE